MTQNLEDARASGNASEATQREEHRRRALKLSEVLRDLADTAPDLRSPGLNMRTLDEIADALSDAPDALARNAVRAIVRLEGPRPTPAAGYARDVAFRAVAALAEPADPSHARAVERMRSALVFADKRGERLAIYDVETAVEAARLLGRSDMAYAVKHVRGVLESLANAQTPPRPLPDDAALTTLLEAHAKAKIKTSGVTARIFVMMGWFGADSLDAVTKRVSQAINERTRRTRDAHRGGRSHGLKLKGEPST